MALKGRKVLVALTGGIACYKVPYLVRQLRKGEAEVQAVMTEAATRFITRLTMETVTNRPVPVQMFPSDEFVSTRHIDLAEWPDLIVVAPATANLIGKVASGISDDLLTTIMCASSRPAMIAPSMNPQMWKHPATQRNVKFLNDHGYTILDPTEGDMACEHWGVGRMMEPEDIFAKVRDFFSQSKQKSQKKKSSKDKNS